MNIGEILLNRTNLKNGFKWQSLKDTSVYVVSLLLEEDTLRTWNGECRKGTACYVGCDVFKLRERNFKLMTIVSFSS